MTNSYFHGKFHLGLSLIWGEAQVTGIPKRSKAIWVCRGLFDFSGTRPKIQWWTPKKIPHWDSILQLIRGFLKMGWSPSHHRSLNIKSWPSDLDDLGYPHDLGNLHLNTEGLLQYNQRDYCNNICSPLHVMMMNKSYNIYIFIFISSYWEISVIICAVHCTGWLWINHIDMYSNVRPRLMS